MAMCWSCIHVDYICVPYVCSLRACFICMVLIMVVVILPYEGCWCFCGTCRHECMFVYAFVMHLSVYMLLCMNFYGEGCCA